MASEIPLNIRHLTEGLFQNVSNCCLYATLLTSIKNSCLEFFAITRPSSSKHYVFLISSLVFVSVCTLLSLLLTSLTSLHQIFRLLNGRLSTPLAQHCHFSFLTLYVFTAATLHIHIYSFLRNICTILAPSSPC